MQLRRELELYAQVRPARSIDPVDGVRRIDVVVIREPTEGLYRGVEFDHEPLKPMPHHGGTS